MSVVTFGVLQDVVEAALYDTCVALCVADVARLQVAIARLYAVVVWGSGVLLEYHLQLVATFYVGDAFRGACGPVDACGDGMCAVGFHGYFVPVGMQLVNEGLVCLQRRLASGENHEARREVLDAFDDVVIGQLFVSGEVGVAERTSEIASREAYEDGGASCVVTFALQRVEDVVNSLFVHLFVPPSILLRHKWLCCPRSPAPCSGNIAESAPSPSVRCSLPWG